MALNVSASSARSPLAAMLMGCRSSVAVTCSTAADSWRTGRRLERATLAPTTAATPTPSAPNSTSTSDTERSVLLVGSSGRPRTSA